MSAPLLPSFTGNESFSESLGRYILATCETGKPAIEAKWVARVAVVFQCVSDGTLSGATGKNIIIPCLLVVARALISVTFWTCFLEVVGAVCSMFHACCGSNVLPYVIIHVTFMPGAFQSGTARQQTASSEWRTTSAAIKLISSFCCCIALLVDFVLVQFCRLHFFVHHSPKTQPRRWPTKVQTRSGCMVMAGRCRRSGFKNGSCDKAASQREAV